MKMLRETLWLKQKVFAAGSQKGLHRFWIQTRQAGGELGQAQYNWNWAQWQFGKKLLLKTAMKYSRNASALWVLDKKGNMLTNPSLVRGWPGIRQAFIPTVLDEDLNWTTFDCN